MTIWQPHPFQGGVHLGFPESHRPANLEIGDEAGHTRRVGGGRFSDGDRIRCAANRSGIALFFPWSFDRLEPGGDNLVLLENLFRNGDPPPAREALVVRRVKPHEGCRNFGVGAHFIERVHGGATMHVTHMVTTITPSASFPGRRPARLS